MGSSLKAEPVFVALTRPQMFAGVTFSYFIANAVISAELFLIFKSFWALGAALLIHLLGVMLCLREPRFFDLWVTRMSRCPRVKNFKVWGCNSYHP
jgi:type IV secretion system protein VirB3